ncbi:MAG: type II toxin-antitoxin system HicB family antitoxin [Cyclobacteriaceae bacterium]|nr:type II toxin-antitoxin system HicB family antitoxin [Cyclobacteriaceae bacterium]
MSVLYATLSKGPDDYGIWLYNLEGIFSAGNTKDEAIENLNESIKLYCEFNADAPEWMREMKYVIESKFEN